MIVTKTVELRGKMVDVNKLSKTSHKRIYVDCDYCGKRVDIEYRYYILDKDENELYKCNNCRDKKKKGSYKKQLLKSKSFEQWCLDNDKKEILDLWDYDKNEIKPSDITPQSKKKVWFKCPRGIHDSELKSINNFTKGFNSIRCLRCESFAQYLIDNYGDNALNLYWDYELNRVSPYDINRSSNNKIWIKCIENELHKSYQTTTNDFYNNHRCPYCNGKKVIKEESLGYLLESMGKMNLWSDKNKISPYKLTKHSSKKVWFKCENKKHKDYLRNCDSSFRYNYRCPCCQFSKGEKEIERILDELSIKYETQKSFDGLVGDGIKRKRKLRFDFYLPDSSLTIEYQGRQHDEEVDYFGGKQELEKRKRYDNLKRKYCKDNNIELLEIWYCDYNNIETILKNKLKKEERLLWKIRM